MRLVSNKTVQNRLDDLEARYHISTGPCICRIRQPDGTVTEMEFHEAMRVYGCDAWEGFVKNVTLREVDMLLDLVWKRAAEEGGYDGKSNAFE